MQIRIFTLLFATVILFTFTLFPCAVNAEDRDWHVIESNADSPLQDNMLMYAAGGSNGQLSILGVPSLRVYRNIQVGIDLHEPVFSAKDNSGTKNLNPDGKYLYVNDKAANTIGVINLSLNTLVRLISLPFPFGVNNISLGQDGKTLYATGELSGKMAKIDIASGNAVVIDWHPASSAPNYIDVSKPNKPEYVFASNYYHSSVGVFSTNPFKLIKEIPVGKNPHGTDAEPQGRYIQVVDKLSATLTIIDVDKLMVKKVIPTAAGPLHNVFDTKGKYSYTSCFISDSIVKTDLESLTMVDEFPIHYRVGHIAISPDDNYLISLNKFSTSIFNPTGIKWASSSEMIDINEKSPTYKKTLKIAPINSDPNNAKVIFSNLIKRWDASQFETTAKTEIIDIKPAHHKGSKVSIIPIDRDKPGVTKEGDVYVVRVKAFSYGYVPRSVHVPKGAKVRLIVTNIDKAAYLTKKPEIVPGLIISGPYGLRTNLSVPKEFSVMTEFNADYAGEYEIYNSDTRYPEMRSTLFVNDREAHLGPVERGHDYYLKTLEQAGLVEPGLITMSHELVESQIETIEPSIVWNAWAEEGNELKHELKYKPTPYLKPDTEYLLAIDLSSIPYEKEVGKYKEISQDLDEVLKKAFLEEGKDSVQLKIILLPDPKYFEQPDKIVEDFKIFGKRIKEFWQRKGTDDLKEGEKPYDVMEKYQNENKDNPDFVLGRMIWKLKTLPSIKDGTAHIGLSIWYNGMPIDELAMAICVSSSEKDSKKCNNTGVIIDKREGGESLHVALKTNSKPPDAALHFVKLGQEGIVVGIFHSSEKPNNFIPWKLDKDANELRKYLESTLIPLFNKHFNTDDLPDDGFRLYNLLFPSIEGKEARGEFKNFIEKNINEKPFSSNEPPSIFIRFVEEKTDKQPFIIPFGLMAVDVTDKRKEFIGYHFKLETPLRVQSYRIESDCISSWLTVLPNNDDNLQAARKQINPSIINKWRINSIFYEEIKPFREWVHKNIKDTFSTAIIILSHHNQDILYDSKSEVLSVDVLREFKKPSIAILNGCGTGSVAAKDFIEQLNKRGVMAVISTSTEVDAYMAGDFLDCLAGNVEDKKDITISQAYYNTLRCVSEKNTKYGANVLRYSLLGNGNLRLCPPKKDND
ncbi:MAG: beta-propeller fold lactonase family protein [Nitrospinae bacterium]|nr:beta-propeller fold lactonase family protein [Nitrospinota bacterium]